MESPKDNVELMREGRLAYALLGAAVGLDLTAAVTLLRWLSWRPYGAWMIAFDASVLVLGGALIFALLLPPAMRLIPWIAAAALAFTGALLIWGLALVDAENTTRWALLNGALLLLVAGYSALRRQRSVGRIPFEVVSWLVAGALVVSMASLEEQSGYSLVLPIALAVLVLIGPKAPASRTAALRAAMLAPAFAVLIFCATAAPPGSHPSGPVSASETRKGNSVVVIVLDTLRRDHMSLYGYDRLTTPHLDEWAQGALVFDDSSSTSSWTLPTHASIFTGLYPRSHGAHGYRSEKKTNSTYALEPESVTLAEIAQNSGIATGAIVSNFYFLGSEFGVDQGFDHYWIPPPKSGFAFWPADVLAEKLALTRFREHFWPYLRARFITNAAIEWVRDRGEDPYFLFVNYLDVHRPNRRPATEEIPLEDEVVIPRYFPILTEVFRHKPLTPDVERGLVNSYDRELAQLDRELARLLDFLESDGRVDHTAVIVTSDHGEFFGEHDLIDHMMHLHNEVVDVPLVVKGPGVRPGRSSKPVQSVDIFPTALELMGLAPVQSQGASIFGDERHPIVSEWYSSANGHLRDPRYNQRFERNLTALREGELRFFLHEDGESELYDVSVDPRETRDVASERPEEVERLRRSMADWQEQHPPAHGQRGPQPDRELSPQEYRQLQELGYVE